MVRAKLTGLAIVILATVFAAPACAADKAPQAYVLLVGIDKYGDEQILPRQHAEADARALYDVFSSPGRLVARDTHVRLLLGKPDAKRPSEPATRANVLEGLKWLQTAPGKDDLVVLAYFGQGGPVGKSLCFFTTDSTFKDRKKDSVASGDIQQAVEKLKSERFIAFIDVFFLGYKNAKKLGLDPDMTDFQKTFFGKDDDKEIPEIPAGRVVFFTGGIKPPLELKKHGMFAKVLVDGLKGKADVEGYEPDGVVTVSELAKYFGKELAELARKVGTTDEEKEPPAAVLREHKTDFVIVRNPAAFPKAHERVVKFDKLAKDEKFSREIAEEGHNLLSRMPRLEAQQNLRKAYQKLADGSLSVADFRAERKTILASTTISQEEAGKYARMVLDAADLVRERFVKEVNQAQLIDCAVRGLYRELNEKLPAKLRDRMEHVKDMKEDDLLKLLADARLHLGKREDLAEGKDITLSLHPMLHKLDQHTDYIDPETVSRLSQEVKGEFTGIGVQIKKNGIKDQLQVVTPIRNTPAYKAGLYAGDIITTIIREVDNEGNPLPAPEVLPTKGMTTDWAVKKIVGKPGTKVKLMVEREGEAKPLEFTLVRGRVEVETVLGNKRKVDDSWDYVIDEENRICYVRLTQFSRHTFRDLEKVMSNLSKRGIKGFILDLRFNPGGLLDSAVSISDLFIDDGMIVTIRYRNRGEQSYFGHSLNSYTAFPMVCLVNGYSASASEIVSACLQDHDRAIIMGSRSYGKGSVQTIFPFENTGGQLKLTMATYWRPSGKNINKPSTSGRDTDEWGVTPDRPFVLDLSNADLKDLSDHLRDHEIIHRPDKRNTDTKSGDFQDRQLEMALEYLRSQIKTAAKADGKKAG